MADDDLEAGAESDDRSEAATEPEPSSSSAVLGAAYHLVFGWWVRPVRAVAARLLMGGVDESNQVVETAPVGHHSMAGTTARPIVAAELQQVVVTPGHKSEGFHSGGQSSMSKAEESFRHAPPGASAHGSSYCCDAPSAAAAERWRVHSSPQSPSLESLPPAAAAAAAAALRDCDVASYTHDVASRLLSCERRESRESTHVSRRAQGGCARQGRAVGAARGATARDDASASARIESESESEGEGEGEGEGESKSESKSNSESESESEGEGESESESESKRPGRRVR